MIKCPTCKGNVERKARYCPACYTVFPSESRARNLAAERAKSSTWKSPPLFFAVFLGVWFLQIDATAWNAEPGSYQAVSRDMKREVLYWMHKAATIFSGSEGEALSLGKGDQFSCAPGASCDVVIHFQSGKSGSYVIERGTDGGARILGVDQRANDLLGRSSRGQIIATGDGNQSVTIKRKGNDQWSVIRAVEATAIAGESARPGPKDGA